MDSLSVFPEELFADVPTETIHRWKENFEQMKSRLHWTEKRRKPLRLRMRIVSGERLASARLVQDWKNEYRRSQG